MCGRHGSNLNRLTTLATVVPWSAILQCVATVKWAHFICYSYLLDILFYCILCVCRRRPCCVGCVLDCMLVPLIVHTECHIHATCLMSRHAQWLCPSTHFVWPTRSVCFDLSAIFVCWMWCCSSSGLIEPLVWFEGNEESCHRWIWCSFFHCVIVSCQSHTAPFYVHIGVVVSCNLFLPLTFAISL